MFYPEGFANLALEKSFIPKFLFFYTIEVCENGYSQNIVTTSLFMTLLLILCFEKQKVLLVWRHTFSQKYLVYFIT